MLSSKNLPAPQKTINPSKRLIRHFRAFTFTFSLRLFFVIFPVQILSFEEKLLLGIEYLFNKTDPKHFLKINL